MASDGLASAPIGAPFGNEPARPGNVDWGLDGTDGGDGSSAFGHREPGAGAHTLQMPAQMRFQFPDANSIHAADS